MFPTTYTDDSTFPPVCEWVSVTVVVTLSERESHYLSAGSYSDT